MVAFAPISHANEKLGDFGWRVETRNENDTPMNFQLPFSRSFRKVRNWVRWIGCWTLKRGERRSDYAISRRRGLKFERLEPRVLLSVQPTAQPLSKAQADAFMVAHHEVLMQQIEPSPALTAADFTYQPEAQASLLGPITSVAGKDLTVTALSLTISGGGTTAQFGDTIQVNYTLKNDGDTAVTGLSFFDAFYLSLDATLDTNTDIKLSSIQFHDQTETIAAGASANFSSFVTLRGYQGGAYNLFVRADDFESITEANETNNTRSTPITITTPNVDLEITSVTPSAATVTQGDSMTVTYVTRNNGSSPTNHFWFDRAYLSTDNIFDSGDTYLSFIDAFTLNPIAAGASKSNTSSSFTLPSYGPTGSVFLIVVSALGLVAWSYGAYGIGRAFINAWSFKLLFGLVYAAASVHMNFKSLRVLTDAQVKSYVG